jgi:hypothetical protein
LAIFAPLFAAFRQKWSLQRPPLLPLTCLPAGVTPPRVIFVAMLFFVALGDSVAKIRDALATILFPPLQILLSRGQF